MLLMSITAAFHLCSDTPSVTTASDPSNRRHRSAAVGANQNTSSLKSRAGESESTQKATAQREQRQWQGV